MTGGHACSYSAKSAKGTRKATRAVTTVPVHSVKTGGGSKP